MTTALEETWPDEGPVLFLGEWCRRYSRRTRWSSVDAEVAPYHWDDRQQLYRDYLYLQRLNERMLQALTKVLNKVHRTEHSSRYWRILVGPWLGYFVQILFDRWQMIHRAVRTHDVNSTIVLRMDTAAVIPQGMADFTELLVDDWWNHWIYGQILALTTRVPIIEKTATGWRPPDTVRRADSLRLKVRSAGKHVINESARLLSGVEYFFIHSCIHDQWRLESALGQLPTFWAAPSVPPAKPDLAERSRFVLEAPAESDFESFLLSMIPKQIPVLYLEGLEALSDQIRRTNWPTRPKVIVTASSHNANDFFKKWAADRVEDGARLVIHQHGGQFGIGKWVFTEEHEHAIADRYFSWGWSSPTSPHTVPMPSPKLLPTARTLKSDPRGGLLLVLASVPRYSYWMYSLPVASQMLNYLDEQVRFADALRSDVRREMLVRPYRHDYGWDVEQRLRASLPDVRFDSQAQTMYQSIRRCRLFVSTYNATTFLETFAGHVPTVMFWNPNHWEIRAEAEPDFVRLREVGVLHDTPEAAAAHVNTIWDDVSRWWTQPAVEEARARICYKYARTSDQWLPVWTAALKHTAVR